MDECMHMKAYGPSERGRMPFLSLWYLVCVWDKYLEEKRS